jgi:hypothetical protein
MTQPGDVTVINTLAIQNDAPGPIVRVDEAKGGFHIRADVAARDAMPTYLRLEGMLCYVVATAQFFQLVGGIANVNWQLAAFGGGSDLQTDVFTPVDGQVAFVLSQMPANADALIFLVNGVGYMRPLGHLTIVGVNLTWLNNPFTMQATDQVAAIYPV